MTKPTIGQDPWGEQLNAHLDSLEAATAAAQSDANTANSGLTGKANTSHTHTEGDVTGLTATLAGKASTSHSHATSDVTGLDAALAAKAAAATLNAHTADTANPHSVTKAQVGLGNAENTSDANKPVSTATQAALDAKAAASHTHAASDITSGVFDIARLATGTPDGSKFVRDDGVLATPPGGGGGVGGRTLSGRYLFNACIGSATNDAFNPAGNMLAIPLWLPVDTAFDEIKTSVGVAGAGGAVVRMFVYAATTAGLPGALAFDAGTFDATSTGDKSIAISETLTAGAYFVCLVTNDAAVRVRGIGNSPAASPVNWLGALGPGNPSGLYVTYTGYTATSAPPSTATLAGQTVVTTNDCPAIGLRAS